MKTHGIFRIFQKANQAATEWLSMAEPSAPTPLQSVSVSPIHAPPYRVNSQHVACTICVQDVSESMGWNDCKPSRLQVSLQACETYLRTRARISPEDQIGIVSFNHSGKIRLPLTPISELEFILDKLHRLKSGGSTDICEGLRRAKEILEDHISYNRLCRVVLLTDGHGGCPIRLAKAMKERGILIEVIGFAGTPSDVEEKVLRKVATTDPDGFTHYWFFKDAHSLVAHYEQLATGILFRGGDK